MPKIKLIIPILIFSVLLAFTSIIKNQTRVIEKKIYKVNKDILSIKKDLHETQLDYFYLSSPASLSKKIKELDFIEYSPMDFSRMYLNLEDFVNLQKKITTLKRNYEKKTEKK